MRGAAADDRKRIAQFIASGRRNQRYFPEDLPVRLVQLVLLRRGGSAMFRARIAAFLHNKRTDGLEIVLRGLALILAGAVLGCGVTIVAFRWHIVRANDGWHMISNGTSMPSDMFADVREWTPNDWADHPRLATALVAAGKGDLVMRSSATNVLDRVMNRR